MPKDFFKSYKEYPYLYFFTKTNEVCKQLNLIDKNIYALDYTAASILSYNCKKDINVLFYNNKYGRLDDKLLDIRDLEQKDIVLFDVIKIDDKNIVKVCSDFEVKEMDGIDTKMYIGKCNNFSYKKYKELYLNSQKEKFYNIPDFLPTGKCYFLDRYFK